MSDRKRELYSWIENGETLQQLRFLRTARFVCGLATVILVVNTTFLPALFTLALAVAFHAWLRFELRPGDE
jgi:hypothetical protein